MFAFPSFAARAIYRHAVVTVRWTVSDIKKEPSLRLTLVFALPIFPGSHPPSIVGVHELNFCVRDGNRWTLMTINTNYSFYIKTLSS